MRQTLLLVLFQGDLQTTTKKSRKIFMIQYWILHLDAEIALSSSQKMENKFVLKL